MKTTDRKDYQKQYYEKNKLSLLERKKEKYQQNKDELLFENQLRYQENKVKYNKQKTIYHRAKRQNDPAFKIREIISRAVRDALSNNDTSKNSNSIINFLEYPILELKQHLEKLFEPWMNWSNWGRYNPQTWNDNDSTTWTWNIDHIVPQAKLPYINMGDDNFKICWSLSNLRPLSSKQNLIKGSK